MAVNPNVIVPQVQQIPFPADDPALFGASLLVIGFNVDTTMVLAFLVPGNHGMNTAKSFYFILLAQFDTGDISSSSTS
jgi:hypothetical protein